MNLHIWMRRLRRIPTFFSDSVYRKVLFCRVTLLLLNKLFPKIKYIGIRDRGNDIFYYTDDRTITLYSLARGNFHRDEIQKVIELLKSEGFQLGKSLIEVGANIGSTSVGAASTNGFSKVWSFEPVPCNVNLIKTNVAINRLEDVIQVVEKAVSDKSGKEVMTLSNFNYGDNRILRDVDNNSKQNIFGEDKWKTLDIEAITLDQFNRDMNLTKDDISLVWIDAQGAEGLILSGAKDLLKYRSIPFYIEFWPYGLRRIGCFDALIEQIETNFARFIDISTNKRFESNQIRTFAKDLGNKEKQTDLLLIP